MFGKTMIILFSLFFVNDLYSSNVVSSEIAKFSHLIMSSIWLATASIIAYIEFK